MSAVNLMKMTEKYKGVTAFVFSSTATVYKGEDFEEESETGPIQPYGRTKFMVELIMKDFAHVNHEVF